MAYVKRITIRSTLKKSINYLTNEKKSEKYLDNEIKYILNENKVAHVYGYNVSSNHKVAYEQMNMIKKQFNKENGVLGYHYIQSFKPNEVTHELAHEIAKEFIEKVFPNCQVICSTHIDKNHIHNHFAINSVMLDGKKFNSCTKSLYYARDISNEISLKYNLSIINKNEKTKNQIINNNNFDVKKLNTKYEMIKYDIDKSISESKTYIEFKLNLIKKGYKINENKYLSVSHADYKKSTRTKTLGEFYKKDFIIKRIENKNLDNQIPIEFEKRKFALDILKQLEFKSRAEKNTEIKFISEQLDFIKRYNIKESSLDIEVKKLNEKLKSIDDIIVNYNKQTDVIKNLISEINFLKSNLSNPNLNNFEKNKIKNITNKLKQNNISLENLDTVQSKISIELDTVSIKIQELENNRENIKSDLFIAKKIENLKDSIEPKLTVNKDLDKTKEKNIFR